MVKKKVDIPEYLTDNGYIITAGSTFLYEVSVYKIYKKRAECWGSKFYKTNKPINIKKKDSYRRLNGFVIAKFIDWLEAPEEYIINNNLKLVEENVRKRTASTRKRSRSRTK